MILIYFDIIIENFFLIQIHIFAYITIKRYIKKRAEIVTCEGDNISGLFLLYPFMDF